MDYLVTGSEVTEMKKVTIFQIKTDTGLEFSVKKIEEKKTGVSVPDVSYIFIWWKEERLQTLGVEVSKVEELLNNFN